MKDGKHVILYVDDDSDFRDAMRTARPTRTLGDLGYRGNLKFGKHIAFRQWALLAVFLESEENV
ncbi:MAG: hypothetical protein ABGX16_21820, partial [Pirellulales bacterium]